MNDNIDFLIKGNNSVKCKTEECNHIAKHKINNVYVCNICFTHYNIMIQDGYNISKLLNNKSYKNGKL